MNTPTEQTVWKWHRPSTGHKSHLVRENEYRWPDARGGYLLACRSVPDLFIPRPNNQMEDPCRRCLRAASGLLVGRAGL